MTKDSELRIGLVGAGNIGRVHVREFAKVEGARMVGVASRTLESAKMTAAEFGLEKVYPEPEALLLDDSLDAVIIASPNQFHARHAIMALNAGKHVLLEKPMAMNSDEAKDIVRAERASGKTVMIAHPLRFQWNTLQIKEQIDKGSLGRIYAAKTGWMRRKGIPGWGTWFTQHSQSGGGPLIDIGVHMLDLSLYLMGNPRPVSVYGSAYAEFGPRKKGIGTWGTPDWNGIFDVEDVAFAMVKMADGSVLTLDVSWAAHMETNSRPFVHILGADGGAFIDGEDGKLLTELDDTTVDIPIERPAGDEGDKVRLSRHFVECLRDHKPPTSSAMTGLTNSLIIDAIFESSRTGHEALLNFDF